MGSSGAPVKGASVHEILPRIAVWLAPLFLAILGLGVWAVFKVLRLPPDADVFEVVAGEWGWASGDNTCDKNPHTISFTPDRTVMTFVDRDGTWEYDIVEHEVARIRGAIRGEKRLTDAGKPVVWDLVMRGPNMYVWHRTDWPGLQTTGFIMRCGEPWGTQTDSVTP